jgi:hypothetical protein
MDKAYQQGLPTWDEVNALTDLAEKKRKAKRRQNRQKRHRQRKKSEKRKASTELFLTP